MLPVGTQSAIVASYAANAAYHAAAHAAAQATIGSFRNAAVLELADRYLGDLPDVVVKALGLSTPARRVLISAQCSVSTSRYRATEATPYCGPSGRRPCGSAFNGSLSKRAISAPSAKGLSNIPSCRLRAVSR
jgi:hypothetical protein